MVGYSNSDFVGCVDSRKSTSRCTFLIAGGAISWKSNMKTIVVDLQWRQNLLRAMKLLHMHYG
jgi:hypothetical protein